MEKKTPRHGIKSIHIEPTDDKGFFTEIRHHPKPIKIPKPGPGGAVAMPLGGSDDNTTKHVHASAKDLGTFITGLFPGATAHSRNGKTSSQSQDGSNIDTYEAGEGDTDEEE